MSKYCTDINCDFYETFPNGSLKMKTPICPFCTINPLINEKPLPADVIPEQTSISQSLIGSDEDYLIVNNYALDLPISPAHKPSNKPTDKVIVTFYTAILLSHFQSAHSHISIRFDNYSQVDLIEDSFELKYNTHKEYESNNYALLSYTVHIPSKTLNSCKSDENLIIPYRYYLNGQEEILCSKKGATHRALLLHSSNFFVPNLIEKYDMLILPPDLALEDQYLYNDFKLSWKIIFNLYSPNLKLSKKGKLLFTNIKANLETILHTLCYSFVCKASKFSSFTKMKHFHNHNTNEEVCELMCELSWNWISTAIQTDLPFHLKFYLSFLCLDNDLMQEYARKIFLMLFGNLTCEFILSIIQEESERNLFLEYKSELLSSPQLLHSAMRRVSELETESLILFLPLYHLLFNSEQDFEEAHSNHSFLDNVYWGLPAGIQFKHNLDIEASKIINAMSQLSTISPILPYSITLLYLRLNVFSQLTELSGIPFLPFFSVLLYRIEKWPLLREETQLRESVFNTFLTQSVQTPNLMNHEHICQASDVIFQIVLLIMGSRDIPNISFKEACLLLQVLAKLLSIYDGDNNSFSEKKVHEIQSQIFNFIPSSALLKAIEQCVKEDKPNKPPHCNTECIDEVIVWNTLYSIQFPPSYEWVKSVCKEFTKRLKSHSLECLLNSITNLCCTSPGTETSLTLLHDICMELIQIAEESENPLGDHELIVQSLVEVPENRISNIIDVLAKILVLHRLDIIGANLVEHILSVSWYPALFKRCSPQLLKNSIFSQAESLLYFCVNTIRKLDSDFQALTISVNYLKFIIEYKSTYLLLLKYLPISTNIAKGSWDETTFNLAIEYRESILSYFSNQYKLIGDLKKFLDSTNSGIYSTEISEFLAIEYKSKSISFLCSTSEQKEFVLMPGDARFNSLNKPQIKNMLNTLPGVLQSQFFKSHFKHNLMSHLETTEFHLAIDMDTVFGDLWVPTLLAASITLASLFDLTIQLTSVEQHFGIYSNCPEQINNEIAPLISVLQIIGESYDEAKLKQSLNKVICYFRFKTIEKLVLHVLLVKKAYNFTGQFSSIESISSLQSDVAGNQLSIITPELFSTADILSDLTELHLEILQTLLCCAELFTWTAGVLDKSADLDNFTDLALNSVASTCFQVNRITSFKNVCTIFLPFIIEVEAIDQQRFLAKLKSVHGNLQKTDKSNLLLTMAKDCAEESELNFWKELKQAHISIGGKIITQLKQIMENCKFILSTNLNTRTINDILKLHVYPNMSLTFTDHLYSLEVLREMQSNIILITPLMHEDKDSAKFVAILEEVIILADLFLQMHISGNIFFRKLTREYTCQSIDSVKQDIAFLRDECKQWTAQLVEARDNNYLLNYFTASQIVNIQVGLEDMNNGKDFGRDTFHLLSLVSEQLSQKDIENAYKRIKHSSSSFQNPINNPESVNLTATLPSRISSIPRDDESLEFSLSSLPTGEDDDVETTVTLIKDLYKACNKTIYSLNDVGLFLFHLCSPENFPEESLLNSFLKDNEPNVISIKKSNLLTYVLSLYLQTYSRTDFPSHHEVLICSENTTLEEIDIFWRRALNSLSSYEIFCLAFIENLKYEIAAQGVTNLKKYLQFKEKGKKFVLVLLCSLETGQSSYMVTALAQYKRIHTPISDTEKLKDCMFQRINHMRSSTNGAPYFPNIPSSVIDPDRSCVRIISSEFAGSGKSLTVLRLAEKLKKIYNIPLSANMCTTINLFESQGCEHNAATKLIDSPISASLYGHIYHIDITATSYEELIPFLFKLLITGVICDMSGRIWRCSKRNYFVIEITLSSQSPELLNFLALFPDWQCFTPNITLEYLKTHQELPIRTQISLFDQKEMESPGYQRVYAYLHKLEYKQKSPNLDTYSYKPSDPQCENPLELLGVLLKYCSIDKPSWSVLKHFISFFNNQLVACESNIYCNMISDDKSWKGFKTFLVDCMILMSRDFTTPSLRNCLEKQPTDIVQGYCIEPRRKWEEKSHPYIFLNEDRQTMTFFGIYITEQMQQIDSFDIKRIIGKKVIPKELYRTLKLNKVDLEEACSTWDRNKMISILSNVMDNSAIPWTDIDPCYVLTIDNLKKMLAIHMRFRCNIPVIVMGETGCGKTRLINFMCKLQAKRRNIENLVVLKVHGETTRDDILKSYKEALRLACKNVVQEVDTILFFDEANTSHTIGLIKEILCDRRIDGQQIPTDIRLQFIAACNPYRKHTPEMISKLASAGLGIITGGKMAREHFGDIPLRDLVYRVIPLPQSLLPLVWDFGMLSSDTENSYIIEIINIHLTGETFTRLHDFCNATAKVLSAVQEYMRERRDECSFVSLRDVERTVRVMLWFYKLIPKLRIEPTDMSLVTYSLILSLSVCYRAKLKNRTAFDSCLIANLVSPLSPITEASVIRQVIDRCQTCIVNLMKIPDHIARNAALKENLFMMYVCIQLKIPLFIIGKPGSSKSLARSIINHSINEGILLEGNKIAEYTRVYMQCYQCSQFTTSNEISKLFDKCQTIQKEVAADSVACVVLDEVGLAEDSSNLPLKVLHSLLEDSATSEFAQQGPNVAFIGLSNWALDPAKMNRGIMVQLEDPSAEELVNTAHAIIKPSGQVDDIISERLNLYVRSLAEGYLELFLIQPFLVSKDYFGLRDFYCLMKMLYSLCRQYNTPLNERIMIHAVKRNFGGITDIDVLRVFSKSLTGLDASEIGPLSDPLSLIRASLDPPLNPGSVREESAFDRSRYLLLLTENYVALDILFQSNILNQDTKVMFGSSFPQDKESFNICHNINRIKVHMELGEVVVLTNLSNLYESLYELLNQSYFTLLGKFWVSIGIGSQRVECPVDSKFRLIVVADKTTVYDQFPPPLINRLEKHILTNSTILSGDPVVKEIVRKLSVWIKSYITLNENTQRYKQNECFIGFQEDTPSFVVYSTISKLNFKGKERENEDEILEASKVELLKLASPDSILRLPMSKLSSEEESISDLYFSFKLFSLSHYLQELFKNQFHISDSPILSLITTRSQLLTETDITELVRVFGVTIKVHYNISNLYLSQFKTEKEFVSCILDEISSIPPDTKDKKIILIQCTDGYANSDLISCAKYKVMEIVSEHKTLLNSNFYFLFIVRLLVTKNSSFAGFCGTPWDSVHIDELRPPYHNLLPALDVVKRTSIAEIFDFHYQLPDESFIYSSENYNYFKSRRLLRCVQASVSRLIDPRQGQSEWKTKKINKLSDLLSEQRHSDIADFLCEKISQLLQRIEITEYSNTWSLLSSLRADNHTTYPTVMKTLSHCIDNAIEPLLAGVLGIIDTHNDLDLAYSKEAEIRELWKLLFRDESLFDFEFLISPESLRNSQSYTVEYSMNIPVFSTSFPFFLTVYQQVTRLYDELNMKMGRYQSWKRFEAVFNETSVGQAVKSINTKSKSNPFYLHYKYLKNFVIMQIPQFQDQLNKVIYVMLIVTISSCQRELKGEEATTVYTEGLAEISIPLIHIGNEIIRERIAFVKEAYSLGFTLPSDHLIRHHNALSNSKTYSQLKHIDFDLFESIINKCWKKVSCIYKNSDTMMPIQYFQRCERLIEENLFLFRIDFKVKLDILMSSWYATQTIVLFAKNIIDITEFQGLLKSQNLLNSILSTLQKIVSHENTDFQSSETFKSILVLLRDMNIRAGKNTSDDEQSSVRTSQKSRLWTMFQIHATRFFLQFLTSIVLKATDTKLPDGLIKEIIDLALRRKEDISDTRDINLFRLSDIHPSAELRCILLELAFREGERYTHSTGFVRKYLEQQMSDVYKTQTTQTDEMVILVLQSLENTHHHHLTEYSTFNGQLNYITKLLTDEFMYSYSGVSHKMLESVAVLRFTITWLMKWYSAIEFKKMYLQSQATSDPANINTRNRELNNCLHLLYKLIEQCPLHIPVLLFLFKTLYFNTGFGDVLSYSLYKDYKCRSDPKKLNNRRFLDLFLAVDSDYCEVLESLSNEERSNKTLKKQIKKKSSEQFMLFAIFSVSCARFMSVDISSQEIETRTLLQRQSSGDLVGFATMQKQKWIQLLPPELKELAESISQNKFLNMRQFHISKETHLNTVSIAGLLCHVAVLLQYAQDNEFLKPLTLIHYHPSTLKGRYLPAVPCDISLNTQRQYSVMRYIKNIQISGVNSPEYSVKTSSLRDVNRIYTIIHALGDPLERTGIPTRIRRLSAISVALLRSIIHCIFTYTLQTKHMKCPSRVTQLVEQTGTHTCSEYFFLHLIQDINDLTTITNKTFEEAVLIIHTLIDRLMDEQYTETTDPTYLRTEKDLEKWENTFETIYVSRLEILNDQVLREKMQIILDKSQHSDISILRGFYEEDEKVFISKLWRHRNIIGYDHLLQVFSCQFDSDNFPLLEKFLNEQPLLSVTKYIPEFVKLQFKLVEKSITYSNNKKVKDLHISDFLEFIKKEELSEHHEYLDQFTSLRIACIELKREQHILDAYYPQMSAVYEITNNNIMIGQLVSTSHQYGGVLTSLIQLLVEIHNSFIDKYGEIFPKKQSRSKSTIPLSLVSSHHLISYQAHLENLIFSNASHSFLVGEGTLITYDFKGIENDFASRFMLNKLTIEDDLKVDHSEGKLLNNLKRLQLNIPQEEVTEDNWNSIRAELMDPHDISEVLSLIELVINFASYGKERPQRPIISYMHEVLKYPNSQGLISKKADETCSLKHLLSLWHNLSIHRAKLSGPSHKFTLVDSCYSTGLDSNQISALKSGVDITNIDDVLTMLYDFILFNLCDQTVESTPNEKLQDGLFNFSDLNLFLTHDHGNLIDSKLIPQDILVSHTVSTWKSLLFYSKELQAFF